MFLGGGGCASAGPLGGGGELRERLPVPLLLNNFFLFFKSISKSLAAVSEELLLLLSGLSTRGRHSTVENFDGISLQVGA